VFFKTPQGFYQAELLAQLGWLEHAFGTREVTLMDRRDVATLRQVHSASAVEAVPGGGCSGQGDVLVASAPGARVGVKTADCLPILLADERRRAVAAVHAGWRGTLLGVASQAVLALVARYDSRPSDLRVAIGPAIGGCCYEVGPEVAVQFHALFRERHDLDTRTRIDLVEANRRQLVSAGVPPDRICCAGLCTACQDGEFHSYRRDGERAGRMLSWVGIKHEGRGSKPAPL